MDKLLKSLKKYGNAVETHGRVSIYSYTMLNERALQNIIKLAERVQANPVIEFIRETDGLDSQYVYELKWN